jgi:cell division ATPase FtsA
MKITELHQLSEAGKSDAQLLMDLLAKVSHKSLSRVINATPEKEKVMGWAVELFRNATSDEKADELMLAIEMLTGLSAQLGNINSRVSERQKNALRLLTPVIPQAEDAMKVLQQSFKDNFTSQLETLDVVISNLTILRKAALDPEMEAAFEFASEIDPVLVRATFKKLGFIPR